MDLMSLPNLSEHLAFQCVLCGETHDLDSFEEHAQNHAERDECWSYASFAGACELDDTLEGWPVQSSGQPERVWPYWLHIGDMQGLLHPDFTLSAAV